MRSGWRPVRLEPCPTLPSAVTSGEQFPWTSPRGRAWSPSACLPERPHLSPSAFELNMRIDLPGRPLHVTATIVERGPPDLVVVSFDKVDSYERARLGEFIRTAG